MSNLTAADTKRVTNFVRRTLNGSSYRKPGGGLNTYRAARELTERLVRMETRRLGKPGKRATVKSEAALVKQLRANVDHQQSVSRNRKLLQRALAGESRVLRHEQAIRLLRLVAMVGDSANRGAAEVANGLVQSAESRRELTGLVKSGEWTGPAAGYEVLALRLPTWDVRALTAEKLAEWGSKPGPAVDAWIEEHVSRAKRLLVNEPISRPLLTELSNFERQSEEAGHSKVRVRYAIRRFFGPFCQWSRTGGACRGWHQMKPAEQKAAFLAGLTMERRWLGPRPRSD